MADERQCRLCLGQEDTEENRLFSPCECNGSMAYIHEQCLNEWRDSGTGNRAFWECPVCLYQYRLKRIPLYHAVMHWLVRLTLTLFFTTLPLVFFVPLMPRYYLGWTVRKKDGVIVVHSDAGSLALYWLLGETYYELFCRCVAVIILVSVVTLCLSACFDCWPNELFRIMMVDLDPRGLIGFCCFCGFVYFIQLIYSTVDRWLRTMQNRAADQVLQVKKRQ